MARRKRVAEKILFHVSLRRDITVRDTNLAEHTLKAKTNYPVVARAVCANGAWFRIKSPCDSPVWVKSLDTF